LINYVRIIVGFVTCIWRRVDDLENLNLCS